MIRGHLLEGSMASRTVEFFRVNPDEELTTQDIRVKWAGHKTNVSQKLRTLVEAGLLARKRENRKGVKGGGTQTVYRAGPKLIREAS